VKAGVIGATGYAGVELVRLLLRHSGIDELIISSVSFEGEKIENLYPNLFGYISLPLVSADDVIAEADIVFSALPHGLAEKYAKKCIENGKPFIDLSADFRFGGDESVYSAWYGKQYNFPELHKHSVYGLPELNRKRIKELAVSGTVIIGNPGCYPTGASLAVYPALAKGLAAVAARIIVDAATGISGGGREPSKSFHYPECADSAAPYKVGSHRHTPEIARIFAAMAGYRSAPPVIFTPHLVPMNRGILSTVYIPLSAEWQVKTIPEAGPVLPPAGEIEEQTARIRTLYSDFYKDEPFVRILPPSSTAATNMVRQSNNCDISVHLDHSGSTLIIISAIDNMVKGAAGQAVQNMNIIFDLDERTGLEAIPALF
jgi:N-acetyl-gamma-glutamyl-phosphate reductase